MVAKEKEWGDERNGRKMGPEWDRFQTQLFLATENGGKSLWLLLSLALAGHFGG